MFSSFGEDDRLYILELLLKHLLGLRDLEAKSLDAVVISAMLKGHFTTFVRYLIAERDP